MKYITQIFNESIHQRINLVKNALLKTPAIQTNVWSFDINEVFLNENDFVAIPHIGSDQLTTYGEEELNRILKIFNNKKAILATIYSVSGGVTPEEYYEISLDLASIRELGREVEKFRCSGDQLLFTESGEWFLMLGWDADVIVGKRDFVEKYLGKTILQAMVELEAYFPHIFDSSPGFIAKALNLLNKEKELLKYKKPNITPINEVELPESLLFFKKNLLIKNQAKFLPSYSFEFDLLSKEQLLPFPTEEACHFLTSPHSQLKKIKELWKKDNDGFIYLSTFINFKASDKEDKSYKMPYGLETLLWMTLNPKFFRTQGTMILTNSSSHFVLLIGDHRDIVVGKKEQLEEYLEIRIDDFLNKSEFASRAQNKKTPESVYDECIHYLRRIESKNE